MQTLCMQNVTPSLLVVRIMPSASTAQTIDNVEMNPSIQGSDVSKLEDMTFFFKGG